MSGLRRISAKRLAREEAARPVRDALLAEIRRCEVCGKPTTLVHEIARGAHRQAALDKRFAVLVLCQPCHDRIHNELGWPVARQLAILAQRRARDYDLAAFNALVGPGPKRTTEEAVTRWL